MRPRLCAADKGNVVGRIAVHPSRPERLALVTPTGSVSNWFSVDDTIDTLRPVFEAQGFRVDADGTVTKP